MPIWPRQRQLLPRRPRFLDELPPKKRFLGANESVVDWGFCQEIVSEEDGMLEGEARKYRGQRRRAKRGF